MAVSLANCSNIESSGMEVTSEEFSELVENIKNSDIYENPKNWEERWLMPSSDEMIKFLRKTTNTFLDDIEKIHNSDLSKEEKGKQIQDLVDALPWFDLDTEEREFLADTIAPAIEAAGFDPWSIL